MSAKYLWTAWIVVSAKWAAGGSLAVVSSMLRMGLCLKVGENASVRSGPAGVGDVLLPPKKRIHVLCCDMRNSGEAGRTIYKGSLCFRIWSSGLSDHRLCSVYGERSAKIWTA